MSGKANRFKLDAESSYFVDIATGIVTSKGENNMSLAAAASVNAYPNPFNPTVSLRYRVASRGRIKLAVYDSRQRLVRELVNGVQAPGEYMVQWDGRDADNRAAGNGIYFYRLAAGAKTLAGRIALVK